LENFLQAKAMVVENFYSFERYIDYETSEKFSLAAALVPFYIMYCTWSGYTPPDLSPGSSSKPQGNLMSTHLNLVSELERLASELEAEASPPPQVSLASIAERIAKLVGVRPDEVAILGLSTKWRHLYFLVPQALRNVGHVPLSSTSALAARTARESRPKIDNTFAKSRHASVFEGVRVSGETAEAIQKIISAPILAEGKVVGIIQISRKGPNAKGVGPDFTSSDLGSVLALCKPLGRLLQRITAE
jgi:hypothetical protein